MKVLMNGKEREIDPGTKMIDVVQLFENKLKNDPMIKSLKKKTGESKLIFVLNGRVVPANQFNVIEIKEGDDVRMIHPFFGG